MTPDAFRRRALSLPGATEASHGGHPDFRIAGKVFASLGYPDAGSAAVMLTPDEQALAIERAPGAARRAAGAWGAKGSTVLTLERLDEELAAWALRAAFSGKSPRPAE